MMTWKLARANRVASGSVIGGRGQDLVEPTSRSGGWSLRSGLFLLMCGLIAATATLRVLSSEDLFLAMDNDSAMRLVQVRDLLAGQSWFDPVQHRLGLGSGVEMHWSRLIDGPLVALVSIFGLVTDATSAEWATLIVWPSVWFGIAFWMTLLISQRVGGTLAAVPSFFAASMVFMSSVWYAPGAIDHHNVQLALLLVAIWGLFGRNESIWRAVVAALCVASSLVIGVELLPLIAVLCVWLTAMWIIRGEAERGPSTVFGLALGASLLGLFLLTAPASAYVGVYCDAVSVDLLLPVLGATLLLTGGAAFLSRGHWPGRLLFTLAGSAALLGPVFLYYPACLSNPLDRLDPILIKHWLDHVGEAQGLLQIIRDEQGPFYSFCYLLGGIGLLIYVRLLFLDARRDDLCLLLVLTAVALCFSIYQVRYMPLLTVLSIPAWARWAGSLRRRSTERPGVLPALAAVAGLLLSVPHVWTVLFVMGQEVLGPSASEPLEGEAGAVIESHMTCFNGRAFQAIASLPPGRVATTSDLGSQVLLQSGHNVITAPYHRNQAGMIAEIRIALAADAAQLEQRLREYSIDYLMLCADDPETYTIREESTSSEPIFVRLMRGDISLDGYPLISKSDKIYIFGARAG